MAGDELELGVGVGDAAVVDERDPAVEVGGLFVAPDGQHVVGAPIHVAREVGGFDALRVGAAIFERPDERGPAVEIFGEIGEAIGVGRHAGDDFVADFPDWAVVVREKHGFRFDPSRRAGVFFRAHERDFAADVFLEKLLRIEQIVFVILLDDVELRGVDERAEMNRGGIDGSGDVFEMQREQAGGEVDLADVAHERDIGVVDGDGEIDLVFFRGNGGLLGARRLLFALADLRPA